MKRDLCAVPLRTTQVETFVQIRNFYGCRCPMEYYRSPSPERIRAIVERAGFTIPEGKEVIVHSGDEKNGFVCLVPLQESNVCLKALPPHFVIDGWPERGKALQIILHFCNFRQDNHIKANLLFSFLREEFNPEQVGEIPELYAPI